MQAKHVLNYASIMAVFGMALNIDGKSDERWHPHAVLSFVYWIGSYAALNSMPYHDGRSTFMRQV